MEGEEDVRRGLWTAEEDALLADYVAVHGEGRWNAVAREAGLKRTGKSCRLRWLNYLRPDVRRGNITAEEQLLILQLHSRWGNRWSKIAEQLPGRTDNEIKNYWRTRVQKHAKSLRCDPNSREFRELINSLWVPLLLQKIHRHGSATAAAPPAPSEEREGGRVVATGFLSGGPPHGSSPSTSPSSSSLATSDGLVSFDGEVADQQPSSWPELLLDDIMWEGGEDDGLLDQPCSSIDDDIWCLQNI